jgi:hypothetical protein
MSVKYIIIASSIAVSGAAYILTPGTGVSMLIPPPPHMCIVNNSDKEGRATIEWIAENNVIVWMSPNLSRCDGQPIERSASPCVGNPETECALQY